MQEGATPAWEQVRRVVRSVLGLRVTPAALLVTFAAEALTSSWGAAAFYHFKSQVAWDLAALQAGHLWLPWVRLFIAPDPGINRFMLLATLLGVGLLEARRGARATLLAIVVAPVASIVCTLTMWGLWSVGVRGVEQSLFVGDTGSSSVAFFCLGAALRSMPWSWRIALSIPTLLFLFQSFQIPHHEFAFDHLFGFALGLLAAPLLFAMTRARTATVPDRPMEATA